MDAIQSITENLTDISNANGNQTKQKPSARRSLKPQEQTLNQLDTTKSSDKKIPTETSERAEERRNLQRKLKNFRNESADKRRVRENINVTDIFYDIKLTLRESELRSARFIQLMKEVGTFFANKAADSKEPKSSNGDDNVSNEDDKNIKLDISPQQSESERQSK